MHNNHEDNILFHGFQQQGESANNAFVQNRVTTAANILKDKSFSTTVTSALVQKYITNPVDDLAQNSKKHTLSTSTVPNKYFGDSNQEAAMFTFGMGLHTVQDTEAHVVDPHVNKCDMRNWDYNSTPTEWIKTNAGVDGERMKNTKTLTKRYINNFLYNYGTNIFKLPK